MAFLAITRPGRVASCGVVGVGEEETMTTKTTPPIPFPCGCVWGNHSCAEAYRLYNAAQMVYESEGMTAYRAALEPYHAHYRAGGNGAVMAKIDEIARGLNQP